MDQTFIDKFNTTEYYVLSSSLTKHPFISESGNVYLFETETQAKPFLEKDKRLFLAPPKQYEQRSLYVTFLSQGATKIFLVDREGNSLSETLSPSDPGAPPIMYLSDTNRIFYLLWHTGQKKYLQEFADMDIIAPMYTEPRPKKFFPKLLYPNALSKSEQDKSFVFVFTTLKGFDEWNESQGSKYFPLKMTFKEFETIRKRSTVIINPTYDRLPIYDNVIRAVLSQKTI